MEQTPNEIKANQLRGQFKIKRPGEKLGEMLMKTKSKPLPPAEPKTDIVDEAADIVEGGLENYLGSKIRKKQGAAEAEYKAKKTEFDKTPIQKTKEKIGAGIEPTEEEMTKYREFLKKVRGTDEEDELK